MKSFMLLYLMEHSNSAPIKVVLSLQNKPIQIYWKFYQQKWKISDKNSEFFHISAQSIDCGYSLEPPLWGGSNECPQSMLLSRNKKK